MLEIDHIFISQLFYNTNAVVLTNIYINHW